MGLYEMSDVSRKFYFLFGNLLNIHGKKENPQILILHIIFSFSSIFIIFFFRREITGEAAAAPWRRTR
jgi:hypothetical protein